MLNLVIQTKGGVGRSVVSRMAIEEMTRPKGKWREYWTLHLAKISPNNRLPRNFKKKQINIDPNQNVSRGFSAAIERSMLG